MAHLNDVIMWGRVTSEPMIAYDEAKEPKKASFFIKIVNQKRGDDGSDELIYSEPFVYTQNPEIIKCITELKKGDIADIRGVITTLDAKKGCICPYCGHKEIKEGEVTIITPTFVEMRYTDIDDATADALLLRHREVSNVVMLIGNLCADPKEQKKPKIYGDIISRYSYKGCCRYQLAIDRHLFIDSDNPTTRTDYPHIISVGEDAEMDILSIHEGSEVCVKGMILTRHFRKTHTCPNCKQTYDRDERATEIMPLGGTEYLNNFNVIEGNPEDVKKAAKENLANEALAKLNAQ